MTPVDLRRDISGTSLAPRADDLVALLRPSVRLHPERRDADDPPPGASRFGGRPDLPDDLPWPDWPSDQRRKALGESKEYLLGIRWRRPHPEVARELDELPDRLPLHFLAQIDLADLGRFEATRALGLPGAGLLLFFYDAKTQPWGCDPADRGGHRVVYVEPGRSLRRREPPGRIAHETAEPCPLAFAEEWTLPDAFEEPAERLIGRCPDRDRAFDEYVWLADRLVGFDHEPGEEDDSDEPPRHRLLGHPELVQNPMRLECQLVTNGLFCGDRTGYEDPRAAGLAPGAADWELLLQLDSDAALGRVWGDVGRIYFWIRRGDLRARRFDATWLILQCS